VIERNPGPDPIPKVSVVVPHLAGYEILRRCLDSLERQTFRDFEVIVVDNGSRDDSVPRALRDHPRARLVCLGKNRGFAGAANAGLAAARAGLIAFVNDDVRLDPAWLELTVQTLNREQADAAGGKLLRADGSGRIASAGCYLLPTGFGRDLGLGKSGTEAFRKEQEIFWVSGAAGLIRREVFLTAGNWDEKFFAYCEDTDLGLRARLAGFSCRYVPGATGQHEGGATGGKNPGLRDALCTRNALYTVIKGFPAAALGRHLPAIIGAHLRALFYLAARGRAGRIPGIELDLIRQLPTLLRERRLIQRKRKISPGEVERWLREGRENLARDRKQRQGQRLTLAKAPRSPRKGKSKAMTND